MLTRILSGSSLAICLISLCLFGCAGRSGQLKDFIIREWKPYIVENSGTENPQVLPDTSLIDVQPAAHADTRDVQDFAHQGS